MEKITTIDKAIETIQDGACVGLGGNTLNRAPMLAVFEMVKQEKKHLRIIKTAGAMDVDVLAYGHCADSVDAGFISYESQFGLAGHYRKGVQTGTIKANEHACYTVISALRAASYGIGFMPVKGLQTTDLRSVNDYFADVIDPFTGQSIAAVKAIAPDVSIVHVQKADGMGNAQILGPKYEDILLSRASKTVIITAEEIVHDRYFEKADRKADIPHFMVSAVVHAPRGAQPCSCYGHYETDDWAIKTFLSLKDPQAIDHFLAQQRRDKG